MDFKNIFKQKIKKDNKNVLKRAVQMLGQSPIYTEGKYEAIAQEGYKGNWVIFRCMQEIIKAAIQLNWKVEKKKPNGDKETIPNHPALALLNKPNLNTTRTEFIKRCIAFKYLGGQAPLYKIKARNGIKEIYAFRPDLIELTPTGDNAQPYKDIKYRSMLSIAPEEFGMWKEFNPNDLYDGLGSGMGLLNPVLKNGDLLNSLVDWNISLLQNGGNLSGILILDPELDEDEFDRAEENLKNKHGGKNNVGKFALFQGVTNFIQTTSNPKDMDWIEGKESTITDICIGMGIDPIIIGINKNSSYNNKNEAEKGLYTKVVIPLMQDLAECLTNFLELEHDEYITIDYSHIPCLQEDVKELFDRVNNSNFMTLNEKREKIGLEPIKNGDVIMLPMNLVEFGTETENTNKEGKDMDFLY